MKKMISILFTLIYLNTAIGMGIDIHFCEGNIADITLVGMGHAHCDCPPGSMPPGCCKNVVCFCKTDNHRVQAITTDISLKYWIQAPVIFPDYKSPLPVPAYYAKIDPDPDHHNTKYDIPVELNILHSVFRI